MRRWLKITLGVLAGLIVLLLINAVVVSNTTEDAEVRDEGAELIQTLYGTLQILDEGDQQIRPPQTPRPGNPIVLLHCYTCSMNWWDDLAPLLEGGHRVIRVDLLGHGGSAKPGAGYSITDQGSAVAEALAKLGVVNATVVGHSLGGTVATALVEQSPQLASRLVIIDQAPDDSFEHTSLGERAGHWPVIGPALDRLAAISPDSLVRNQYEQVFAPGFSVSAGFENPDQVVDDLRTMTYTSFKDSSEAESDYSDERPLDDRAAEAQVPLLVIFGAEDQIYDADEAIARWRAVPDAETHLVEGAGHSPNVEKPEEVAPLILGFTARGAKIRQKPAPKKAGAGKGKKAPKP
jgi:pimeloyl-ACP methyl ester carboxylesterase